MEASAKPRNAIAPPMPEPPAKDTRVMLSLAVVPAKIEPPYIAYVRRVSEDIHGATETPASNYRDICGVVAEVDADQSERRAAHGQKPAVACRVACQPGKQVHEGQTPTVR
jgi:hypothetical protein